MTSSAAKADVVVIELQGNGVLFADPLVDSLSEGRSDACPEENMAMTEHLAAALRAVRGYVPQRIWWEAGPAQALLAYHTLQAG